MWKSPLFNLATASVMPPPIGAAALWLAVLRVLILMGHYLLRRLWRLAKWLLAPGLLLVTLSGCRDADLTRMQSEVNRAATELVTQDAKVRQDWMTVHNQLEQSRQKIDQDRRALAERERLDPVIAQAIRQVGGIALCLLPLLIAIRLLTADEDDPSPEVFDVLLTPELKLLSEAASAGPGDGPPPPRLGPPDQGSQITGRLPGPSSGDSPTEPA